MHRCSDGIYREGDATCACARNRIAELEEQLRDLQERYQAAFVSPYLPIDDTSEEPVANVDRLLAIYPDLPREFAEVVDDAMQLHMQKCHDYGSDRDPYQNVSDSQDWNIEPWVGAMVRMEDKARRLKEFIKKGSLLNESVEDSLRDRVVYAIIAMVLYRRSQRESR